jgi:hypothetical protein
VKNIKSNLYELYELLKNKNNSNSVYDIFSDFARHISFNLTKINYTVFSIVPDQALLYIPTAGKQREMLIESFIEMLRRYNDQINSSEDMTSEEIEDLIIKLEAILENERAVECLECGSIISSKENKCPKCGWTWKVEGR